MKKQVREALICSFAVALMSIPMLVLLHCGAQQKPIRDVAVTVAADVCKEVATAEGLDPNMVELLCDDGSQIVKVLMPRQQWQGIKARGTIDGGPGI